MLAKIATREDLGPIKECLKHDVPGVREAAAEILAKIATRDDLELVKRCLGDDMSEVRWAGSRALAKIATRDDLELVKGCLGDDVPGVREAAAQALAKIATREALELITRLLNDRIAHIREIAQHYLVTAAMNIKKKGGRPKFDELQNFFAIEILAQRDTFGTYLKALADLDNIVYSPYPSLLGHETHEEAEP